MAHIHDKPGEVDHTASAYIVRTDLDKPRVMLHMHKKLGRWIQFGGHIELDENPWQAVVRELREESGYDIDQFKVLQPKQRLKVLPGSVLHPQPAYYDTHLFPTINHRHSDAPFALVATEEPRNEIAEDESTEIKSFSRSDLDKLTEEEIPPSVQAAAIFILDVCLSEWEQVDSSEFEL